MENVVIPNTEDFNTSKQYSCYKKLEHPYFGEIINKNFWVKGNQNIFLSVDCVVQQDQDHFIFGKKYLAPSSQFNYHFVVQKEDKPVILNVKLWFN